MGWRHLQESPAKRLIQLIVYQTSDSTFQGSSAPAQHVPLSGGAGRGDRPSRRPGRADRGHGGLRRAGAAAGHDAAAAAGVTVVRLGLPPAGARTPYDQLGDFVPWAATGIVVVAAMAGIVLVRRDRGGQVALG